jgi:hypothetical protein
VAQCLVNPEIVSISVKLGVYGNPRNTTSQQIKAASWTPHPDPDDIGVVKLSQKVANTPISLSFTSGFPAQGRNVTAIGYDSKILNEVQIAVRNWDDCNKLYGEANGTKKICAGGNGKVRNELVSMVHASFLV